MSRGERPQRSGRRESPLGEGVKQELKIKLEFGQELRRFSTRSFAELLEQTCSLYQLAPNSFTLKYKDEADLVTVSSDRDLTECRRVQGSDALRLAVVLTVAARTTNHSYRSPSRSRSVSQQSRSGSRSAYSGSMSHSGDSRSPSRSGSFSDSRSRSGSVFSHSRSNSRSLSRSQSIYANSRSVSPPLRQPHGSLRSASPPPPATIITSTHLHSSSSASSSRTARTQPRDGSRLRQRQVYPVIEPRRTSGVRKGDELPASQWAAANWANLKLLSRPAQNQMRKIVTDGRVSMSEFSPTILPSLAQLPPSVQIHVLGRFDMADLAGVRSVSGFFIGLLKTARAQGKTTRENVGRDSRRGGAEEKGIGERGGAKRARSPREERGVDNRRDERRKQMKNEEPIHQKREESRKDDLIKKEKQEREEQRKEQVRRERQEQHQQHQQHQQQHQQQQRRDEQKRGDQRGENEQREDERRAKLRPRDQEDDRRKSGEVGRGRGGEDERGGRKVERNPNNERTSSSSSNTIKPPKRIEARKASSPVRRALESSPSRSRSRTPPVIHRRIVHASPSNSRSGSRERSVSNDRQGNGYRNHHHRRHSNDEDVDKEDDEEDRHRNRDNDENGSDMETKKPPTRLLVKKRSGLQQEIRPVSPDTRPELTVVKKPQTKFHFHTILKAPPGARKKPFTEEPPPQFMCRNHHKPRTLQHLHPLPTAPGEYVCRYGHECTNVPK